MIVFYRLFKHCNCTAFWQYYLLFWNHVSTSGPWNHQQLCLSITIRLLWRSAKSSPDFGFHHQGKSPVQELARANWWSYIDSSWPLKILLPHHPNSLAIHPSQSLLESWPETVSCLDGNHLSSQLDNPILELPRNRQVSFLFDLQLGNARQEQGQVWSSRDRTSSCKGSFGTQ